MAPRVNPDQPKRQVLGWKVELPHDHVVLTAQIIITKIPRTRRGTI